MGEAAPFDRAMFCPNCRAMVFPKDGRIACPKCGYEGEAGGSDATVQRATDREIPVLEGDTLETLPKTEAQCPECGHREAHYVLMQTRKADEPETMILTCAECKHKWRKY